MHVEQLLKFCVLLKIINLLLFIMKNYFTKKWERSLMLIMFVFTSIYSYAQDKGLDIDVDINKGDDNLFAKPWVWIVGAAVFILLLVALLRGGKK